MSLINLASKTNNDIIDQQPFNFKNHFPQPLIIKANSQVCLTHFYHFRDDGYYRITSQNNVIAYMIANFRNNSGYRYATLKTSRYTGEELAVEIARAMNSVILQENYLWSCAFTNGNPLANPPEVDKFVISFTNITTPANKKGGIWTSNKNSNNTGTLVIVNNDANNQVSTIQNNSNTETDTNTLYGSAILDKGILLHEGVFRIKDLGFTGIANEFDQDLKIHQFNTGLIRNAFSAENNINVNNSFDNEIGDILIQSENYDLIFSNLQQRQGTTSIDVPNGKVQIERRTITDTDLEGIFNETDKFSFEIYRTSATTQNGHDFVIRMLKSIDGGANYVAITDGTGGNASGDGRPVIYTQTINTVVYTSLIYSTRGIPDGTGGIVTNPTNGKSSGTNNRAVTRYAPYKPFISIDGGQKNISGIELNDEEATLATFAENSGNTGTDGNVVVNNVYVMTFSTNTTNGYDYTWAITDSETAIYAGIGSAVVEDYAFKQSTTNPYVFDVYADNNTAIASATKIGDWTFDPFTTAIGASTLAITALPIDPLHFKGDVDGLPVPKTTNLVVKCDGIFNTQGNVPTLFSGESVTPFKHGHSNHNEKHHTDLSFGGESGVNLGADLSMASQLILGRLTQDDIDDNDANPPKLDNNTAGGSLGATIGFGENIIANNDATLSFSSDITPIKIAGDDTLHISIPELTNVKSQEGETSNIGKTIKVVPKSVFNVNNDNGALSYNSPYEDWIDINNGEQLDLNELTIQIRKPDMTLATSLQPTTRATIKIRENPLKLQEKANNEMVNKMASLMTQSQMTDQNLVVKYTGS